MKEKNKKSKIDRKMQYVKYKPLNLTHFVPISHDRFFREMFSGFDFGCAFLRASLKSNVVAALNLTKFKVLSGNFLTRQFRDMQADMIYCTSMQSEGHNIPFYTILEYKSSNNHGTIFQVSQYTSQFEFQIVERAKKLGCDFEFT